MHVVHSTAPQASSGSGQSTGTGEGDTAQHGGQLLPSNTLLIYHFSYCACVSALFPLYCSISFHLLSPKEVAVGCGYCRCSGYNPGSVVNHTNPRSAILQLELLLYIQHSGMSEIPLNMHSITQVNNNIMFGIYFLCLTVVCIALQIQL